MEDRIEALSCERGDDLVSFLYHELSEREARDFEGHLSACSTCAHELESFREIRGGVVAWREQTLGLSFVAAPDSLPVGQYGKPSALAAIRQFFALSPVWLKGAVAFASILFVAALALLVMNLNTTAAIPAVAVERHYSEAELRAKIEEAVQARLNELKSAPEHSAVGAVTLTPDLVLHSKPKLRPAGAVANTRRAPLTKSEREQLAADLRLISSNEDSDLELWSEQINR